MSTKQQPRRQQSKQSSKRRNNNNNGNTTKKDPKLSRQQQIFNAGADPRVSPMSPEIRDYANALANPFEATPAGIPVFPVVASQKIKCFVKNFMVTSSTNGQGFIIVRPHCLVTNDIDSVYATDNTFAGTTIAVAGTGINAAVSNSPFTSANYSADETQFRLVSIGIRWKYSGTELDRGGMSFALVPPDHRSMFGMTVQDIMALDQVVTNTATREWNHLVWRSITPTELAYGATNPTTIQMAVWFTSPISGANYVPQHVYFEVFGIFEAAGRLARSADLVRPDDDGFQVAQAALAQTKAGFPDVRAHTATFMKDITSQLLSRAARIGMNMATAAARKAVSAAAVAAATSIPLAIV